MNWKGVISDFSQFRYTHCHTLGVPLITRDFNWWLQAIWRVSTPQGPVIFVVKRILFSLWSLKAAHPVLLASLSLHCHWCFCAFLALVSPVQFLHSAMTTVPSGSSLLLTVHILYSISQSDCLLGNIFYSHTRWYHIMYAVLFRKVHNGYIAFRSHSISHSGCGETVSSDSWMTAVRWRAEL